MLSRRGVMGSADVATALLVSRMFIGIQSTVAKANAGYPHPACYNLGMRIASGKVVSGRVELDGELPEGASVTVLALEGDETFEADAETEKMLLESMAQCDDGRTTPFADFLSELRSRE